MTAVVPAADTAKAGTFFVNTVSPHSGSQNNGLSNVVNFTVFPPPNPVPTISKMTPSCAVAGSSSFPITILGTNFLPASDPSGGSHVNWNTATHTMLPIFGSVSPTQIQATVSASLVATPVTATVTVSNPPVPNSPAGGGAPHDSLLFTGLTTAFPAAASATAPAQTAVAGETPAGRHQAPCTA